MLIVPALGPAYGEATARPMPEPSEMKMKAIAQEATAPAMTTLQLNAERAPPVVWMTSTFSPTMAVSLMKISRQMRTPLGVRRRRFNKAKLR